MSIERRAVGQKKLKKGPVVSEKNGSTGPFILLPLKQSAVLRQNYEIFFSFSLSLSEIMAMNSELVGLPREFCIV